MIWVQHLFVKIFLRIWGEKQDMQEKFQEIFTEVSLTTFEFSGYKVPAKAR